MGGPMCQSKQVVARKRLSVTHIESKGDSN